MDQDWDSSQGGSSSFAVSVKLYELSGWRGDWEWADHLPITEKNCPGYSASYLFGRLERDFISFSVGFAYNIGRPYDMYFISWHNGTTLTIRLNPAQFEGVTATTTVDALACLCITLFEQGNLLPRRPGMPWYTTY